MAGLDPLPQEVIVSGFESDPHLFTTKERFSQIDLPFSLTFVLNNERGHIPPVLKGMEEARQPFVAFIDDDVLVPRPWLHYLIRWFHDPRVAAVGGPAFTAGVKIESRPGRLWGRVAFYGRYHGNLSRITTGPAREVFGLMEGNWAIRKDLFQGIVPDLFLNYDDAPLYGLDLTFKIRRYGYKVLFDPQAWVHHFPAPRIPELSREDRIPRIFAYNRNYTYLALSHYPLGKKLLFLLWWCLIGERQGGYGVLSGSLALLRGRVFEVLAAFRGKFKGAQGYLRALLIPRSGTGSHPRPEPHTLFPRNAPSQRHEHGSTP